MTFFTVLFNSYSIQCLNDLECECNIENDVKKFLQDSESYHIVKSDHIKEASKKVQSILNIWAAQYGFDEYKFLDIQQFTIDSGAFSPPKLLVLICQEANVEQILSIIKKVILHNGKIIIIHKKRDDLKQIISQLNDPLPNSLVELRRNLEEMSQNLLQLASTHFDDGFKEEINVFLRHSEQQYLVNKSSEICERLLKIKQILANLPEDLKHIYANEYRFLNWKDLRELKSEHLAFALPKLIILVSFEQELTDIEALKQLLLEYYKLGQKKVIFVTPDDKIKEYLSSNQTDFHNVREVAFQTRQMLNNFSNAYLDALPNETNQNLDLSQFLSSRDRNYVVVETPYLISAATDIRIKIDALTDQLRNRYSQDNYIFLFWNHVEDLKNKFSLTFKLPHLLVLICQTHPSDTGNNLLESLMYKLSLNNNKKLIVITGEERLTETLNRINVNINRVTPPELLEDHGHQNHGNRNGNNSNFPTLGRAAESGDLKNVKFHIDNGSKIDACAPGSTMRPIDRAAKNGHFNTVLYLIRRGATYNWDKTMNPLHRAAMRGHVKVATVLLENYAIIDAKNADGETALHLAVRNGHLEMVQTLIGFYANLESVDSQKNTPLHEAAKHERTEIAYFLLRIGANHEAKNNNDLTPICIVAENGNERIMKHLLEIGANVNCLTTAAGGYTRTPLHIAARCGHDRIVELLLKFRADINKKTSLNETVSELGQQSGNPNVQTVLNRWGSATSDNK